MGARGWGLGVGGELFVSGVRGFWGWGFSVFAGYRVYRGFRGYRVYRGTGG